MSCRIPSRSPWWGLVLLGGGCLNPQPDTNPLSPEATSSVDVSPPSSAPGSPVQPAAGGSATANEGPDGPSRPADRGAGDAGTPPEPDAGAPQERTPVTFSATDAGPLDPDAGAPSSGDD